MGTSMDGYKKGKCFAAYAYFAAPDIRAKLNQSLHCFFLFLLPSVLYQVALYILLVPFLTLGYCMKILVYLVNGYNLLKSGEIFFLSLLHFSYS